MPNFCTLTIAGHLSQDPELRRTQSGIAVCKCSIAYNRGYGEKKEACFVPLVVFKEQAERFAEWLHKGDPVLVHGSLQLEEWQAQDGTNRSKLSMIVDRFETLMPREKPAREAPPPRRAPTKPPPPAGASEQTPDYGDVPFLLFLLPVLTFGAFQL